MSTLADLDEDAFSDRYTAWLRDEHDLGQSTRAVYARRARAVRRAGLTPREWFLASVKGKAPKGTVISYRASASRLRDFYLAHGAEALAGETLDDVKPSKHVRKRQVRVSGALEADDLKAYLKAVAALSGAGPEVKCILHLIPLTGLRVDECVHLGRRSIQRAGRAAVLVVDGKGDKERTVPLSKKATKLLQAYTNRNRLRGRWLFPSPEKADSPITASTVRHHHRRAREVLGAGWETFRVHDLRHTFASQLLANGTDRAVIQHLLGHESAATTEIYLKTHLSTMIEAVGKL